MRRSPALAAVTGLLLGTAITPSAFAQSDVDRATARQLGEEGGKALDAKDFKTAEDDFRRASSLVHAPTLLLGLARALAGEGKLVEAQETYRRIVREGAPAGSPPAFQSAVEDAGKEVESVSPRIGGVKIMVKTAGGEPMPANAQVTWDGQPVSAATLGVKRPADPGSHAVHVSADGYKPVDLKVDVPVSGTVDAPLTIEKDPNATPTAGTGTPAPDGTAPGKTEQPTASSGGPGFWPWVALGVGGAGLIAGGITGGLALGAHSNLQNKCGGGSGTCPPSAQSDVDSYNTFGAISTVGFVVGGVGAAAGVVLLLLKPNLVSTSPAPAAGLQVHPVLGLGAVGAEGTF
jgi:hypothetical protein